ncbi:MAG TPA: hypothetical protein VIA06_21050 [Candidatus Dormibacteraeota bacterium]|jgi:hypothetical protein|nr:hypothetical protein [Candidatus Dormibacteraeota bacterium]
MSAQADRGGTAAETVTEFLSAFLVGSLTRAVEMVREDFTFRAPLIEGTASRETFFAGAEEKRRFLRGFRVVRQCSIGTEVSTLYEIDVETGKGSASMLLNEWHTVREGRLASSIMTFDTAASAARLLGDALGGHHD